MVRIKSKFCPYDGNDALGGIVGYFRKVTKTLDPYQKGLINIYASQNDEAKANIFIENKDGETFYWNSQGINSWITIDFGINKVSLTHYTLGAWGQDFLPRWEVSGSNDNETWDLIHDGKLEFSQGAGLTYKTFPVDFSIKRRYIRIMSLSERFFGDDNFFVHKLGLFGFFHSSSYIAENCRNKHSFNFFVNTIILLLS